VSNINRSGITFSSSEDSKSSDEDIVSGFVPVYDLELPREYAYDAWNNRISYHVTLSLTEMSTYNQFSGVIRLNDQDGEIVNWNLGGAQYVLVSNGESGCVEAYEDFQNCQNFHTFLMKKHSQSKDSYYDDFLVYEHFISLNHLKAGKECYLGDILKSNKQNRVNVVPHGRSVKVCNHSFFEDNPASKEDCVTFECLNGKLFEQLIIQ
jgi:hypothetical protein